MAVDKHQVVVDPAIFTISHSSYNGLPSNAEKRREIKKLLDKHNFGITPEKITAFRAGRQTGIGGLPQSMSAMAIMEGIVYVRCYWDNTTNTGKIEHGKPVVFDTVKGWGVTGINAAWGTDEYKILGTAMDDYQSTAGNGGLVPIKLDPEPSAAVIPTDLAVIDLGVSFPISATGSQSFLSNQMSFRSGVSVRTPNPGGNGWSILENSAVIYNPTPFVHSGLCYVRRCGGLWLLERNIRTAPHYCNGAGLGTDYGSVATSQGSLSAKILCPVFQQPFLITYCGSIATASVADAEDVTVSAIIEGISGTGLVASKGEGTITIESEEPGGEDTDYGVKWEGPSYKFSFGGSCILSLSQNAIVTILVTGTTPNAGALSPVVSNAVLSIVPQF
jgi:hypothetical protein